MRRGLRRERLGQKINDMKTIFKNTFITILIQLFSYIILLYILEFFEDRYFPTYYILYLGNLGTIVEIIFFAILILSINILSSIVNRKWLTRLTITTAIIIYFVYWITDFDKEPYKTFGLLIIGIGVLLSKLYIDKKLKS